MLFRKRKLKNVPLVMRKAMCDCIECSKIFGNGYLNDGINEPLVGDCIGICKGWKICIDPTESA